MEIRLVGNGESLSLAELQELAKATFGDMVKIVVDIGRKNMAVGGELHSDAEALLLEDGSRPEDLWGANIFPFKEGGDRIEYQSLINIRPRQSNRGMEIEDETTRQKVRETVKMLCPEI